jgi:hypothetical protein
MSESPLMMLLHGAIIAVGLYLLMRHLLKQSYSQALTRSVLLGLLVSSYMIVFGHGLPTKINSNLL